VEVQEDQQGPVAVLTSGGVDSAVLVAAKLAEGRDVQPIYVRFGLAWEEAEQSHLARFLSSLQGTGASRVAPAGGRLRPLTILDEPVGDVYGAHWSLTGRAVPDADTPDEAVYLPGRNLLLLAKSTVYCAREGIGEIALGVLAGNPFPDSRRSFYEQMEAVAAAATGRAIRIETPFSRLTKADVLRLGADLALEWTFSCIAPVGGIHCGRCNKCGERRRAFAAVSIPDRTAYAPALAGARGRE
jgi:7-cyano-7-deazaguanine synthase